MVGFFPKCTETRSGSVLIGKILDGVTDASEPSQKSIAAIGLRFLRSHVLWKQELDDGTRWSPTWENVRTTAVLQTDIMTKPTISMANGDILKKQKFLCAEKCNVNSLSTESEEKSAQFE